MRAQGTDIVRKVRYPQRLGQFTQVLEEAVPVGPGGEFDLLFGRESAGNELLRTSVFIDGRNHSGAGAGEGTGTVDRLSQHGVEVEAGAHAQDRIGKRGNPVGARIPAGGGRVGLCHGVSQRFGVCLEFRLVRWTGWGGVGSTIANLTEN